MQFKRRHPVVKTGLVSLQKRVQVDEESNSKYGQDNKVYHEAD